MGVYVGNRRVSPVIMATPIYIGSYNIVTDLGLTTDSSQSDIIIALENEISTPQYANYCFVDIPYANYSEVSGYDQFTTTSDYVGYYVLVGDTYTLVTADNKDTLSIIAGTTVAYSVSYTSYFEKIQRYRYNGNSWEYEYDVDFSGYANVDASNFTDSGTTFLSGLGMPDVLRIEDLTTDTSVPGTELTAIANGWFFDVGYPTSSGATAVSGFRYSDEQRITINTYTTISTARPAAALIPVKIGTKVTEIHGNNTTNRFCCFIYAEGTPTPPQP